MRLLMRFVSWFASSASAQISAKFLIAPERIDFSLVSYIVYLRAQVFCSLACFLSVGEIDEEEEVLFWFVKAYLGCKWLVYWEH